MHRAQFFANFPHLAAQHLHGSVEPIVAIVEASHGCRHDIKIVAHYADFAQHALQLLGNEFRSFRVFLGHFQEACLPSFQRSQHTRRPQAPSRHL